MKQEIKGRPRQFNQNKVLDAAVEVFWSHGFEGSSAQMLCEQTGLGRGSLYNTFGSKQKLYEAALLRYQEKGLAKQREILEGAGGVKERLRALLVWAVEQDLGSLEQRACMALFAGMELGGKDPVVTQITQAYTVKLEGVLCHLFSLGQRSGEIPSQQPALQMARAFLASYYGLRILSHAMRDRVFLYDALEGLLAHY